VRKMKNSAQPVLMDSSWPTANASIGLKDA
jgi:hypothetical protein